MKKSLFLKSGLLAALCVLFAVGQSGAADLAEAAGVMAEVESMSVSAKASLADAALGGDPEAIKEAKKRSDAIDAAVAVARDAFKTLKSCVDSGDTDAAATAEEDLAKALVQVRDALMGAVPAELLEKAREEPAGEQPTGEPDRTDDPPNIHDVPWQSQGMQAYYQDLFGEFWDASAFGHEGFGDRPATPE